MSITISFGKWGGFYFHKGFAVRACFGFVAFTYFPCDIDEFLTENKKLRETLEKIAYGFAPDAGQEALCVYQMEEVAQEALK